jgi:hypothetical protein
VTASCGVCGRQVETSESGQAMPCVAECLNRHRTLDGFLRYAVDSCVNPRQEQSGASILRRMAGVYSELAIVARARGEEALAQSHERAVKLFEEQAREVEAGQ